MNRAMRLAAALILTATACGGAEPAPTTAAATTTTGTGPGPTASVVPGDTTTSGPSSTPAPPPPTTTAGPAPDVPLLTPGPGLLPAEVVVAGPEGVAVVAADLTATTLTRGPVHLAVDDGAGGLVFQVRRWLDADAEDQTVIWWVPAGGTTPQDVLRPSAGHWLTLHDAVPGDPASVYYSRREGSTPEDLQDTLRRFDLAARTVTEIAQVGGWEWLTYPISIGAGLIAGTWGAEGHHGFSFYDESGTPIDIPGDPYGGEEVFDCSTCPDAVEVDPTGTRLAWVGFEVDAATGVVQPGVTLTVAPAAGGDPEVVVSLGRPDQGWWPESLDLAGDVVVVSRLESGQYGAAPLPAWVVDLSGPRVIELPIAGRARLLRAPLEVAGPVALP